MRALSLLLPPLFALSCGSDPAQGLAPACPAPSYLARSNLGTDWHYRRTVVHSRGPYEGLGDLRTGTLRMLGARLHLMVDDSSVASWRVSRSLRVSCVDGQVQEVESPDGPYLHVAWHESEGPASLEPTPGWALSFSGSEARDVAVQAGAVEFSEQGTLTADPATCAEAALALGNEPPCSAQARLQHTLRPVDDEAFTPHPDDGAFGYVVVGDHASRSAGVPIYYLPPEPPPELVSAARAVEAQLREVLPGFEIRENSCSPAGVQQALAQTGVAGIAGSLVDQCRALQRASGGAFTWQKPGSLHFNTIALSAPLEPTGWGSYAARSIEPGTGRILAADLFMDLQDLDRVGERVRAQATQPLLRPLLSAAAERTTAAQTLRAEVPLRPSPAARGRSVEGLLQGATQARALDLSDIADDRFYATLVAESPYPERPVPFGQSSYAALDLRVEHMLDPQGRAAAARWMRSGHSFLTHWAHPGHGLTQELLALEPADAAAQVVQSVLQHRLLHGLLESMGLSDNPAGSWSSNASVLDSLPAEYQHLATTLRPYDVAALSALYLNEAPTTRHRWCTIEAAMLTPSLECGIDDFGDTARASMGHAYGRWLAHYPVTQLVDDARGAPRSRDVVRPALDVMRRASLAAQEFAYLSAQDPNFALSGPGLDLSAAVRQGANFVAEVLSVPYPGRHCPVSGARPVWLVPSIFLPGACDPDLPLQDPEAVRQGQVEVPLGIGRDVGLYRPDPEGPWTRVGISIDQSNVLWAATLAFASGWANEGPSVGLIDLVPELQGRYDDILSMTPYFLHLSDASTLGGRWCEQVVPAQVVDVQNGGPPTALCADPSAAVLQNTVSANHLGLAIYLRQTDALRPRLLLYRVGVNAEQVDWDLVPPEDICTFTDLEGEQWRSRRSQDAIACGLIEHAQGARDAYETRIDSETFRSIYEVHRHLLSVAFGLGQQPQ